MKVIGRDEAKRIIEEVDVRALGDIFTAPLYGDVRDFAAAFVRAASVDYLYNGYSDPWGTDLLDGYVSDDEWEAAFNDILGPAQVAFANEYTGYGFDALHESFAHNVRSTAANAIRDAVEKVIGVDPGCDDVEIADDAVTEDMHDEAIKALYGATITPPEAMVDQVRQLIGKWQDSPGADPAAILSEIARVVF